MLLSLTGAQIFAESLPAADHAVTASAPDGRSVAVWQQPSGRDNFTDVHAQLFDGSGQKVGGNILVTNALENTYQPTVAMNASGQFVVAWTLQFSTTDTDVHASLFNANGTVRAADVGVATSWMNESGASVGIAANGSFAVSYTLAFNNTSDEDVHVALFNADAQKERDIGVAVASADESHSHVTMSPGGAFAVSYLVGGSTAVKYYTAAGQPTTAAAVQGSTSGQHPTPPPSRPTKPPTPELDGTLAGGYVIGGGSRNAGYRYDLAGIGNLAGLGETMVLGNLHSLGNVRSGEASGVLTLENSHGTVRLVLEGPAQRAFASLPTGFHFTVTSATGAYSHLRASGTALLRLSPASHTLNLTIEA